MNASLTNTYKIAGLTIQIQHVESLLKKRAEPYLVDINDSKAMDIFIGKEKLLKAREKYPHLTLDELEYIQTGLAFAYGLLDYDGFCLHSSAIALENSAVLFSAPCGTGKSTHTHLWQKYFGEDNAYIINDDKPALRWIEDKFYVYGTPWSGKNNLHLNMEVPLKAIVFLEQAKENHIQRLDNKQAVTMMIYQSLRPEKNIKGMDKLLSLLDILVRAIPIYRMGCNISEEAVELAYDTIYKRGE